MVVINEESTEKKTIVNIPFISKPLISKKSKLKPVNCEVSIKKPVMKICNKNVIPIVIKDDNRKYVKKLLFMVKKSRNGLLMFMPILKTNSVAIA
jgi:hypothetical protein